MHAANNFHFPRAIQSANFVTLWCGRFRHAVIFGIIVLKGLNVQLFIVTKRNSELPRYCFDAQLLSMFATFTASTSCDFIRLSLPSRYIVNLPAQRICVSGENTFKEISRALGVQFQKHMQAVCCTYRAADAKACRSAITFATKHHGATLHVRCQHIASKVYEHQQYNTVSSL